MIPPIRPATKEEIETIAAESDLTPTSAVWAWPQEGKLSDMAVVRQCMEIDPMHFAPTSASHRKAFFAWGLFNMLRVSGVNEIYFNIDTEGMEDYISILEKMGAQKTSAKPQYRFKLVL